ncbi:MAG: TIGR00341 family protein [Patescibacteria group bacterium]|nr:TIGR00341 family protein [Patescibacteria group bacterium]
MLNFFKGRRPASAFNLSRSERNDFFHELINSSSLKGEFYFLLIISLFIVMAGLLKNNIVLLIGGMLVAPLLSPVLAISLSIIILNGKVAWRSLKVFLITTILSLLVSMIFGLVFPFRTNEIELMQKIGANGFDILIAAMAGAAASLTWAKKNLVNNLAGVAITVTLVPPLVIAGFGLAALDYNIFIGAIKTYLFNVAGIIAGSLIIFTVLKFHNAEKKVLAEVKQEDNAS